MIVVRDRLYQRMKSDPSADTSQTYKKVRNMVVSMTRNAKRAFEKKQSQNQRSKPQFSNTQMQNRNSSFRKQY